MQRPPCCAIGSFCIKFCCYADGIWVDLSNTVESAIDLLDSGDICLLTVNNIFCKVFQVLCLTLTRSTLVNKRLSRPVSSSSNVTSIKSGKLDAKPKQLQLVFCRVEWLHSKPVSFGQICPNTRVRNRKQSRDLIERQEDIFVLLPAAQLQKSQDREMGTASPSFCTFSSP